MKGSKKKVLVLSTLIMITLLMFSSLGFVKRVLALTEKKEGFICEGVLVNGIDLSGKSVEEAKKLLKSQFDHLMAKKVVIEIQAEGESKAFEEVAFSELGFESASQEIVEEAVEEAASIGEKGNLIERYKELKDTAENKVEHKFNFKYDEAKLDAFIQEIRKKYEMKAEDAVLTRENGAFIINGGQTGYEFDVQKMETSIKEMVNQFVSNLPDSMNGETKFSSELKVTKPKYAKEELSKIKDLLGTYTTSFAGSARERKLNIINGARLINGTVLLPGEVLSANKKMYPYTLQNGYHLGWAFVNGDVVRDMGGGICQVSTTLYNASLYSEIGIEKRQNHSLTINYAPLARDAAIAGDYKDLVIKNTREEPIYLEAVTANDKITFNIYGHETRDVAHRKVDFETVTIQTIAPGEPIVTKDAEQPEDYEKVTQAAWTGYKSELYKIVTVDGVVTERTLVNRSTYRANPARIVKGTKKVDKVEKDEKEVEKKDKKDKSKVKKSNEANQEDAVQPIEDTEAVDSGPEETSEGTEE